MPVFSQQIRTSPRFQVRHRKPNFQSFRPMPLGSPLARRPPCRQISLLHACLFSFFPTRPFSFPPLTRLVCFFLSPHVLHCFPPNYRLACTSRATPLPSPFNFSPKNTQPLGYLNKKKQTQQGDEKNCLQKRCPNL